MSLFEYSSDILYLVMLLSVAIVQLLIEFYNYKMNTKETVSIGSVLFLTMVEFIVYKIFCFISNPSVIDEYDIVIRMLEMLVVLSIVYINYKIVIKYIKNLH